MSDWIIKKEEKKKMSVMISSEEYDNFEKLKKFISQESDSAKVSDSQAIEIIIKIASKNSKFKKFISELSEN